MPIEIPGYKTLNIDTVLFDYNGTIATDGAIPEAVRETITALAKDYIIYVLTADTHGTAKAACEGLPVTIHTFPSDAAAQEKLRILQQLGADRCVAIGNGRNDVPMCQAAALSIGVMGSEGMYSGLSAVTDVTVKSIDDAMHLLLKPKRLIATLRG